MLSHFKILGFQHLYEIIVILILQYDKNEQIFQNLTFLGHIHSKKKLNFAWFEMLPLFRCNFTHYAE